MGLIFHFSLFPPLAILAPWRFSIPEDWKDGRLEEWGVSIGAEMDLAVPCRGGEERGEVAASPEKARGAAADQGGIDVCP
jgi:hypothetical protein